MITRFYHKTKFGDDTLYLEYKNDKMYAVSKEKELWIPEWTLEQAERYVEMGLYKIELIQEAE